MPSSDSLLEQWLPIVKKILLDFADTTEYKPWEWSQRPSTGTDIFLSDVWVGNILRRDNLQRTRDRLSVRIESVAGGHQFRVMEFDEYIYRRTDDTRFLCLGETSLTTPMNRDELAQGIAKLYSFLKDHPFTFTARGDSSPKSTFETFENGITRRLLVLDKD